MKPGDKIDKWELRRHLGSGGNADVWLARSADSAEVALKVLKQNIRHPDAYQRFRDEVAVLLKMGLRPGVLPIISSSLPNKLGATRAWIAMPVATPIRTTLGTTPPLDVVVEAVRHIAGVLGSLAADNIFHRDIKPENLYSFEDSYAVGDFGLADFPEKSSLTADGRWLGPLHFLAPEMLTEPASAAGGPADV